MSFPQEQSDPFSIVSRIEQVAFPGPPTVLYIEHAELILANGTQRPNLPVTRTRNGKKDDITRKL